MQQAAVPPDAVSLPPPDAGEGEPGRRERKRRETRDRLYEAAISLFTEQGFEATTMDAIGERADVARATVFNYFPHKVAFLREWGVRRRAYVTGAMAGIDSTKTPIAALVRRYFGELAALNLVSRPQTTILIDASWRFGGVLRDPAPDQLLAQLIEKGVNRGEIRADVEPALVGQVLSTSYFSTVVRWIDTDPEPFELPAQLERMIGVVLHGVLTTDAVDPGA